MALKPALSGKKGCNREGRHAVTPKGTLLAEKAAALEKHGVTRNIKRCIGDLEKRLAEARSAKDACEVQLHDLKS